MPHTANRASEEWGAWVGVSWSVPIHRSLLAVYDMREAAPDPGELRRRVILTSGRFSHVSTSVSDGLQSVKSMVP